MIYINIYQYIYSNACASAPPQLVLSAQPQLVLTFCITLIVILPRLLPRKPESVNSVPTDPPEAYTHVPYLMLISLIVCALMIMFLTVTQPLTWGPYTKVHDWCLLLV